MKLKARLNTSKAALALALFAAIPGTTVKAADINWSGGTASYTNTANWVGGVVPGTGDTPINDTGLANLVQINIGDPDWSVNDLVAGGITDGSGAYIQYGQTVNVSGWFHLGAGVNSVGAYTLNDGTLNVLNGRLFLGEGMGSASTLNINGGVLNKAGDVFVIADGGWNGSGARIGTVNHNGGTLNSRSEIWIGQVNPGVGIYNLHAGATVNLTNWIVAGRAGSDGTFNMDGGTFTQFGGGNFAVGEGSTGVGAMNHSGGTITLSGELWIGNGGGKATNNMSGTAVLNEQNWLAVGRGGGNGTWKMTSGTINKTGNGSFIIADGNGSVGLFDHSGGTVTTDGEFWIGQSGGSTGQYDLSGMAALVANNWVAVGRGGTGVLNISGGSFTKNNSGNQIVIGGGGTGTVNQSGGAVTNLVSQTWIGEGGTATWNLDGGTAAFGVVHIAQTGTSIGTLNVNGGSISAAEITTGSTSGFSTLNFNGGTIVASGDSANFIHDLSLAQIKSGGAIFDSQGFSITISQNLYDSGGGSLTKNGAGTLTLSGANGYSGDTIVNQGRLATTTDSGGSGNYSVADSAILGLKVQTANAQLNVANLTLGSSAGASVEVDLGAFGNPIMAPLNASGTLAVAGTITVNVADALPQLGQFPLIKYGAKSGSGSFVIGSVPVGVVASIVDNTANGSIDINITSVNVPRWDGQANGNWDIGVTTNWINVGNGLPTTFGQGNTVTFDDTAVGTTTVNLVATVNPTSVTANNSSLSYTLTGTGKISGTGNLTKQGSGTLTIANSGGNNYTGKTIVSSGVLNVTSVANGGSPSSIGAASASPTNLVLNGGVLSYSGPAGASMNRGVSLAAASSTIDVQSNLTFSGTVAAAANSGFRKTGPAQLTYAASGSNTLSGGFNPGTHAVAGTLVFDGSNGGQTNRSLNDFWVGGSPSTGAATVLTNTTLLVDSWLAVGRGNGTVGNVSTLSLYNSSLTVGNVSLGYWNDIAGNLATQSLWLTNSTLINKGLFNIAESGGSTASVNLSGTSVITNSGDVNLTGGGGTTASVGIGGTALFGSRNRVMLGQNGGTGSMVISNSGKLFIGAWFSIGNGNGGNGSLLLKDSASINVGDLNITDTGTSTGSLTIQDNAVASGNAVYLGKSTGSIGTGIMSGGTVISRNGDFQMGASGSATWTQTGGSVLATNWAVIGRNGGGSGVYNISAGSLSQFNTGNQLIVAENGTGTLNMSGTAQILARGAFAIGKGGSGNGTVNLNGGTLTIPQIIGGGGVSTINFNGATVVAGTGANANFLAGLTSANVQNGGLIIDSGANTINIGQALLGGGTNTGGLTKNGAGTLRLNGVNTYTGATLINAGTFGGTGTIASPVTIATGATLAPGASIGTLTINHTLTLSAGSATSVEVSTDGGTNTSDLVTGVTTVTYAGTLVVSNAGTNALGNGKVFKLFNATSASGNFSSVTVLPSGTGVFNPATGEVTINPVVNPPTVNQPKIVGGNFVFAGTGGTPNGGYSILTSTNIAAPLSAWTTNTVGTFDGTGAFSNGIPFNASEPTRFFLLRAP